MSRERQEPAPLPRKQDLLFVLSLAAALWAVNLIWLALDTRPPVWDMALHQAYALHYLPDAPASAEHYWEKSGNYPPLVHLAIALSFFIFGPNPDAAAVMNLPATLLLFWAVYALGLELAGRVAARWACLITAVTPYLMWMSRETILDYWLSAWFVVFLVTLCRTRGFERYRISLMLGVVIALGLCTKWFFAGLAALPMAYVSYRSAVWKDSRRLRHLIDALLVAGLMAGIWYLPNMGRLRSYFAANMQIGAREGEPPVLSFQSFIYYLRLLEGYQFFALLFGVLVLASFFVWRRRLLAHGGYLAAAIFGVWLSMTLLRTKDPRFTMPLLGLLAIVCGAWIQSWARTRRNAAIKAALAAVLVLQAYAINFGIPWLPEKAIIAEGYQGTVRWDWNVYLQSYFGILGAPEKQDWKQEEILRSLAAHAGEGDAQPCLALIPDLPRFNAANFLLSARLQGMDVRVDHLQSEPRGLEAFEGFRYVLMTEADQGMPWTTVHSRGLNQLVVDHPQTFRLLGLFALPNGDQARLYFIDR